MDDKLDQFVEQLQEKINEDTRAEFGETVFNRWREPKYMERMNLPDGYGCLKGSCGDTMEIFLKFKDDRIIAASFMTDGCGPSQVCGSYAVELAHGKSPEDVADINGEMILDVLGGLPEDNEHCAFLAASVLHEALDDYMRPRQR